jgi:hypothetical protein
VYVVHSGREKRAGKFMDKMSSFFSSCEQGDREEQISTSDNNDNGDEENLLGLFFDAKVVDHHASKIVVI